MSEPMNSVCYREGPLTVDDYNEAIAALMDAKRQLVREVIGQPIPGCTICTDGDHTAESCHHNPLVLARQRAKNLNTWQCWHCGYEARTAEDAEAHFGRTEDEVARCIRERAT